MMFDRLVKHHKIKNLLWIWSVDRPEGSSLKFEERWPGPEYVDILSLGCYRDVQPSHYDELLKLANGKPIGLAEVGNNISLSVLEAQPKWTRWMKWAGFGPRGDATNRLAAIVQSPRSWSLSDPTARPLRPFAPPPGWQWSRLRRLRHEPFMKRPSTITVRE
jgi:mannan endo-1,4-beta-mannosidase